MLIASRKSPVFLCPLPELSDWHKASRRSRNPPSRLSRHRDACCRRRLLQCAIEDLITRTERIELAGSDDTEHFGSGEDAGAMCNHDRNTASSRDAFECRNERDFSGRVEIGVGLVQDKQERIPIQCSCKATLWRWPAERLVPWVLILVS